MMCRRYSQTAGFTLIELIAAMTAATLLLVALAATIGMSSRLLETPFADNDQWHDREIADRLAADLRYATSINAVDDAGFSFSKPNPTTGVREQTTYQTYMNGLTRQVDNGAAFQLDAEPPSHRWLVDGFTSPTGVASANIARVHAVTTAATSGIATSLQVELPHGCRDGDLLLLAVAARSPWFAQVSPNAWNFVAYHSVSDLQMAVLYQVYASATAVPVTITAFPNSAIAATLISVENVDISAPLRWQRADSGYAWSANVASHPNPLESIDYEANQLNVQVFAATGQPWHEDTFGLASFTDVGRATAAPGLASETSIGIAVRNGATPALINTPRVWHQADASWGQIAVQIGAAP